MNASDEKLNKAIGDWLASWPVPERDADRWQQAHDRIMTACGTRSTSTKSPDDCFVPPCPQLDEEGTQAPSPRGASGGASMSDESDRPKRASLKEIAQRVSARAVSSPPAAGAAATAQRTSTPPRASTPPPRPSATPPSAVSTRAPEAKDSDSGILDLRAARESFVSAGNNPETAAGTVGLFEDEEEGGADKPPIPKAEPNRASLRTGGAQTSARPLILGSFVALGAIAAVAIFAVRSPTPITSGESIPAAASAESMDRAGARAKIDQPSAPLATLAPSAVADLLAAPAVHAAASERGPVAALTAAPSEALGREGAAAKGITGGQETDRSAAPSASPSSSPSQDSLAGAMARAVGGSSDKSPEPAAQAGASPQSSSNSASVPEIPSQGAIQGAVGAVMGSARACIAGMESPSHAQIAFSSDGHVASVTVSGSAAGKPAEGCIIGALKRAKVGPFQRPTYSVGFTIRPM